MGAPINGPINGLISFKLDHHALLAERYVLIKTIDSVKGASSFSLREGRRGRLFLEKPRDPYVTQLKKDECTDP